MVIDPRRFQNEKTHIDFNTSLRLRRVSTRLNKTITRNVTINDRKKSKIDKNAKSHACSYFSTTSIADPNKLYSPGNRDAQLVGDKISYGINLN